MRTENDLFVPIDVRLFLLVRGFSCYARKEARDDAPYFNKFLTLNCDKSTLQGMIFFLVADTQLLKRPCPSVGPTVHPLVGPSVVIELKGLKMRLYDASIMIV